MSEDTVIVAPGILDVKCVVAIGETEFRCLCNFADEKGNIRIAEMMRVLNPLQYPSLGKALNALATALPLAVEQQRYLIACGVNEASETGIDNFYLAYIHMKV